jgi:60 kDa SS-A/Ro ribonucleoprotein
MDENVAGKLAKYAVTGVLQGTYQAGVREDVGKLAELASAVSSELVAKTALVARAHGRSKTLPALLVATLAARDVSMMERVFARVIDDGPSLLTFCDAVRSGSLGRKSFGSAPRRALRNWFSSRSPEAIFRQSIGRSPSMSDVIKMVRPAPRAYARGNDAGESDAAREALYGYLVGKNIDRSLLPPLARALDDFKHTDAPRGPVPDLPLEMLTALPLRTAHWNQLTPKMTFSQLRQHLGTLLRHGVLADPRVAESVAERLSDPRAIARAKAKPYTLYTTLRAVQAHAPHVIVRALERAIELALGNVPTASGGVTVNVDGSGSMLGPLAGARRSFSDALRCVDVATLIANAYRSTKGEAITVAVSDYESASMSASVRIDLQPRGLFPFEREGILFVAGFSDEVFDVIAAFARGDLEGERWRALVEDTSL